MRWAIVILCALGLLSVVEPGRAVAGERIEWQDGAPSIFFRHVSISSPLAAPGQTPKTLLVTQLQGRLLSFSEQDTLLYAVFLRSSETLPALDRLLSGPQGRAICALQRRTRECPGQLGISGSVERIRLESNGIVTVHADEGLHPEADFLAVVNGAGEILGTRPVWTAAEKPAAMALNETPRTP